MDLLTTLNQLAILRLDARFMMFIRTDMEGNLAKALYETGVGMESYQGERADEAGDPDERCLVPGPSFHCGIEIRGAHEKR